MKGYTLNVINLGSNLVSIWSGYHLSVNNTVRVDILVYVLYTFKVCTSFSFNSGWKNVQQQSTIPQHLGSVDKIYCIT